MDVIIVIADNIMKAGDMCGSDQGEVYIECMSQRSVFTHSNMLSASQINSDDHWDTNPAYSQSLIK